jgi:predicted methyltransferase
MTILKVKTANRFFLGVIIGALFCITTSAIAQKVDLSGRTEKDLKRDVTSKPAQIIEFAGVKKGSKVLDFLGGAGYYSEILMRVVGIEGKVVLHNNQAYIDYVGSYMAQMEAKGYLSNITKLKSEAEDLKLGEEQFDVAFLVLGYHDFFYKGKAWEFNGEVAMPQLFKSLKPRGKLLIIDHNSAKGRGIKDAKELHRIEDSFVKKDLEKYGFKFIKQSNILRNDKDDYAVSAFDSKVRRKTDRFVMLFEKGE